MIHRSQRSFCGLTLQDSAVVQWSHTHAHIVSSFFPEALQCYCALLLFEYSAPVVPCASATYLSVQQSRLGVGAAEHRQEWLSKLGHTPLCFLPQAHQKWKVILDKHTHTDGNTFLIRKTHTHTYLYIRKYAHMKHHRRSYMKANKHARHGRLCNTNHWILISFFGNIFPQIPTVASAAFFE